LSAKKQCKDSGFADLCSRDEICANIGDAKASSWLVPGIKDYALAHAYLPISDSSSGDYLFASLAPALSFRTCLKHTEFDVVPGWGSSSAASIYRKQVCCSDKDSGWFFFWLTFLFLSIVFLFQILL
tara:strand:+ start:275 stop:655 length:381 start_codon:yes stop_codon:yes gene_type:complete